MEISKLTRRSQSRALWSNQRGTNCWRAGSAQGAGQGDHTGPVCPVLISLTARPSELFLCYSVSLLQSSFLSFHPSVSLVPVPHPGLLICGMTNPGDKAFCAVSSILGFFVLAVSVLPFLLIPETHGAEDSKEAQRERSVSEVVAQCRRRLQLQHLQIEKLSEVRF